jgi:hypothetical protein
LRKVAHVGAHVHHQARKVPHLGRAQHPMS